MPIPTKYEITYSCGHSEVRDMSDVAAGSRSDKAAWYARGKCRACWAKDHAKDFEEKENVDLDDFEQKNHLPDLDAYSGKQEAYARRVRKETIIACFDALGCSEDEFEDRIIVKARTLQTARWWLNTFTGDFALDPESLEEALNTAEGSDVTENPF